MHSHMQDYTIIKYWHVKLLNYDILSEVGHLMKAAILRSNDQMDIYFISTIPHYISDYFCSGNKQIMTDSEFHNININ